jgi:hypothetical protein
MGFNAQNFYAQIFFKSVHNREHNNQSRHAQKNAKDGYKRNYGDEYLFAFRS